MHGGLVSATVCTGFAGVARGIGGGMLVGRTRRGLTSVAFVHDDSSSQKSSARCGHSRVGWRVPSGAGILARFCTKRTDAQVTQRSCADMSAGHDPT
jgi:hypothetical protein